MRLRWRRWYITYPITVGTRTGCARAGPYLTRSSAAHAVASIWRDKPTPPVLRIVKEP